MPPGLLPAPVRAVVAVSGPVLARCEARRLNLAASDAAAAGEGRTSGGAPGEGARESSAAGGPARGASAGGAVDLERIAASIFASDARADARRAALAVALVEEPYAAPLGEWAAMSVSAGQMHGHNERYGQIKLDQLKVNWFF